MGPVSYTHLDVYKRQGWWFTEPEQLGYATTLVSIPLPHGVGWGWVITPKHARPGRWAVHVHGRGALPHETLRGLSLIHI